MNLSDVANTSYNWLSMMQKAVNTIFYVAARPSLCCRLIASGLMHEAKRSLAYFFLKKREVEQIETINFEFVFSFPFSPFLEGKLSICFVNFQKYSLMFRNPPNSADVDEFGDLLAMGKEWLQDCSETEDEELVGSQNVGLVGDENLSMMKKDVLELLDKEKEQSFLAWETVAERVCAFAGQVIRISDRFKMVIE